MMARGKIEIKRIENTTNRQVTYSKRRNGLIKKANELTVLCDAKVSIMMFSSTNKLTEHISPGITMKQVYDRYQQEEGVDLWQPQYEKMQEKLRKLREVNNKFRTDIRQRMGASLNDLSFEQLLFLEQEIETSLVPIRERKVTKLVQRIHSFITLCRGEARILVQFKHLSSQIETSKKKGRNAGEINRDLVHQLLCADAIGDQDEDPQYGLVDNGVQYDYDHEPVYGYAAAHGGSRVYSLMEAHEAIGHQPNIQCQAGPDLKLQ